MPPQSVLHEKHAVNFLTGVCVRRALAAVIQSTGLNVPGATKTSLPEQSWRLLQINHRPGAGVTGVYAVATAQKSHSRCRTKRHKTLICISTAAMPLETPVIRINDENQQFSAWVWPHDPWLPGLQDAVQLNNKFLGEGAFQTRRVSYRPTRRAVLRVLHNKTPLAPPAAYIKVVRPHLESGLVHRHNIVANSPVPTPKVLAASGTGAVALEYLEGPTAAQNFCHTAAPTPEHLLAILDNLPSQVLDLPARPSWSQRVQTHARSAVEVLPEHSDRITRLAQRVAHAYAETLDEPLVATHGDFHPGNVIVGPHPFNPMFGPITGVLDLDGLGPGHLSDDLGCYVAHLWALATEKDPHTAHNRIRPYLEAAEEVVDSDALRARIAGVLVSLIGVNGHRKGKNAAALRLALAEDAMT